MMADVYDRRTEHTDPLHAGFDSRRRSNPARRHGHAAQARTVVGLAHHGQLQLVVAKPNRDVVYDRGFGCCRAAERIVKVSDDA